MNSSAENFHLWTALQKMSNISLEAIIDIKIICLGEDFLENLVSIQHLYWIKNTFSFRSR